MPIYREVNRDFFKTWTPEMAYVLGFFAADGTLTTSIRGAKYFDIQVCDKDLVYKIRSVMKSNHKVLYKKGRGNHKDLFRLQIGSKEIYKDLTKIGFVERKTMRLVLPSMPDSVFGDFVRGYFDGDGNVWVGLMHKERVTQTHVITSAFTSGTKAFLLDLQKQLANRGMRGNMYCQETFYRLSLSIISSLKLYELMYGNMGQSKLCLKRKKRVFEHYIQRRNKGLVV